MTLKVQLVAAGRMETVEVAQRDFAEIAPGEFLCACPPKFAPKIGVVKLMRAERGLYQPVIQALPSLVWSGEWRPALYGCSWRSAVRLALAGFIEYQRPVPHKISIVLESFLEHCRRVKAEPNFWTPERQQRLAEAEGMVRLVETSEEPEGGNDANRGDLASLPGFG